MKTRMLWACLVLCGCTMKVDPVQEAVDKKHGTDLEAIVAAQECVQERLKYPHDADFNWDTRAAIGPEVGGYRHWVVTGTVLAANALGAKLTHEYSVTMRLEDNTWKPMIVEIDGQTVSVDEGRVRSSIATAKAEKQAASQPQPERIETTPEPPKPVSRKWTSTTGTTTEAEFAGYNSGTVKLKRTDGSVISVPLDKLSAEDQQWIRKKR